MRIRVSKAVDGRATVLILPGRAAHLPPILLTNVRVDEVGRRVKKVLDDMEQEQVPVPGTNGQA